MCTDLPTGICKTWFTDRQSFETELNRHLLMGQRAELRGTARDC